MSEKKSWDIQPKRRVEQAPPSAPVRAPAPVRTQPTRTRPRARVRAERAPIVKTTRERVPQGKSREPLREQRIRARKRARIVIGILAVLVVAILYGALWLPAFRVSNVFAAGPDSDGMRQIAARDIEGTFYYVVPGNSILLVPESRIRADIEATYPDVSAVTIQRSSFTSLSLLSIPRVDAFTWCGQSPDQPMAIPMVVTASTTAAAASSTALSSAVQDPVTMVPQCYSVDSSGLIFASSSSDENMGNVLLYGALAQASSTPIGNTVEHASAIPDALQFVKALSQLGVTARSLVIRGDEADVFTPKGTRITYVLGREQQAAQLAQAALPNLDVTGGTLDYVDLRFADKVYYMAKGASAPATASSTPATAH